VSTNHCACAPTTPYTLERDEPPDTTPTISSVLASKVGPPESPGWVSPLAAPSAYGGLPGPYRAVSAMTGETHRRLVKVPLLMRPMT